MAAVWMVGLEDELERCAEICIFEVFGDALDAGTSAAVGMGVHPFREPIKTVDQAPDHPMQMMVAVFDFPDKAASAPPDHVPLLAVDWIHFG